MARIGYLFPIIALVACTSTAQTPELDDPGSDQSLAVYDGFDRSEQSGVLQIETQFPEPDYTPGVDQDAWRTDGFSSWAQADVDLSSADSVTISTWLILESYPSDHEVPVSRLSPSSIANQKDRNKGFDLYIDTYGQWGLWVATSKGKLRVQAPDSFPLYEWSHIVARVDADERRASLFLNGLKIAEEKLSRGARFEAADTPLILARPTEEVTFLNFTFNWLNAAYDTFSIHRNARSDAEILASYDAQAGDLPDWTESLAVPDSRFATDHLRPRVHAMPAANWTNEPHGMVRRGDRWHLFFQRTPNGPYKTQMHWGHMVSDDLVNWQQEKDALWPELQTDDFGFDQKGIWSGDVILDGDKAFAFYTSVNHGRRLSKNNPGIAMAVSEDENLRYWQKLGPIMNTQHVRDFRDPYLWREGGTWHMIIGAHIETGGGLVYYVLDTETGKWRHAEPFTSMPYSALDIDSLIWEMPVFEPLNEDVHVLVVNPIAGTVSKYSDEKPTRGVYWTGSWDGKRFTPHYREPKNLDILPGHLSPTVARGKDGAIRAIGIVDERRSPQSQEDAGWAHMFSLPRTWFLMPDGRSLGQAPSAELQAMRGDERVLFDSTQDEVMPAILDVPKGPYELQMDVAPGATGKLELGVFVNPDGSEETGISLDLDSGEVVLDKSKSTLDQENEEGPRVRKGKYDADAFGEVKTVRVFVDASIIEVFINDAAAFSVRAYPSKPSSKMAKLSTSAQVSKVTVWPLQP